MARLAPCLRNLFDEIDIVWPFRSHGLDGWIGDAAHQLTQSDHNPDSRGIVHAVDVDRRGIDPNEVVNACIDDNRPTSYVVWNRQIWSRDRQWRPRPYTGSNPHTDHIHVSVRYGDYWESSEWHWGLIALGTLPGGVVLPAGSEDMSDWHAYFDRMSDELVNASWGLAQASAAINKMMS